MTPIRTIHDPNVLLKDFTVDQFSEYYVTDGSRDTREPMRNRDEDFSKRVGLESFFILVNGMSIRADDIELCTVDMTGKYPRLTTRLTSLFGEFLHFALPKDGDILSLFYRSAIEDLKPLRMDFIITDVQNDPTDSSWIIHGVINIPELFRDSSYYKEGTSLETMLDLSKKMNLGFATNEESTDDSMNWLCPNKPFDLFLKDVNNHSWKDQRSFFDYFIDNYYTLNYVNVFKQLDLEREKKINLGLFKFRQFIQTNRKSLAKVEEDSLEYSNPLVLHNWKYNPIEETMIKDLSILNNSSRISLEEGYQKFLHFYDFSLDDKVELINEALTSKGFSDQFLPLKGNLFDEGWRKNTRHLWGGISYSLPDHNVHPLYYQAEAHNYHNIKETEKFGIQVTLDSVNFNLYRYMVIPVFWYEYGDLAKKLRERGRVWNTFYPEEPVRDDFHHILDFVVSGFYILKGHYIDFVGPSFGNPPRVQQRLILSRTEWPKHFTITDAENKPVTNLA